jgi:2-phosphosulfolactate phosphatase
MIIEKLDFIEGARRAKGMVVIIDVFRAFSVACYALDGGAAGIIATESPEEALRLKVNHRNALLAGERNERKIDGFDFGNSPTEIIKGDLNGRILIHCTTAGTRGLAVALSADTLLAASIVNASATAEYIMNAGPSHVTLVAMGYRGEQPASEDDLCASMIEAALEGRKPDWDERLAELRTGSGKRFFDPGNIDFSPPTDFFLCTMTDRFDFALVAERRYDGNIDLRKKDIRG